MNLDDLHAFAIFSEHLNFTHTAEHLLISQPALHVKIKKMSSTLGVPLYKKVGRSLELTEQGIQLAQFARETLDSKERFLAKLHGNEEQQPVTLAAGAGSYLYLLGPALSAYKSKGRGPLNLLTAKREEALQLLRSGRCDMAVTVLGERIAEFRTELLSRIPCHLVVREEHPLATKPKLSLRDLQDAELILPPNPSPFRVLVASHLKLAGVSWEIALEATGWQLMMHFVSLGMGSTLVNGCCKIPDGCVAVPVDGLPTADYYLLSRKGAMSPNAESLRTLLVELSA